MSRNGSSSPALQHHLSGEQSENAEGASPDYPVFDVTCPELASNNGHNAYKTACIARLTAKVVQVPCRRCKEALKLAQEGRVPDPSTYKQVCSTTSCRKLATPGFSTCKTHREAARKYYHTREK